MRLIPSSRLRPAGCRRLLTIFATVASACLLSACGNTKAKQTVTTFLDTSLTQPEYDITSFGSVDSTERVTLPAIRQMRQFTAPHFRKGVSYAAPTEKLRYVRVVYIQTDDTIRQTFYLNNDMTGVVCVKNDTK